MVEQLLQTISRELSVVDVMGVFRGTHNIGSHCFISTSPFTTPLPPPTHVPIHHTSPTSHTHNVPIHHTSPTSHTQRPHSPHLSHLTHTILSHTGCTPHLPHTLPHTSPHPSISHPHLTHHTPPPPTHTSLTTPLHLPPTPHSPHPSISHPHLTHHTPPPPTHTSLTTPLHLPPTPPHPGSIEPLQQLQPALINFIREHCLNGAKPTPERKETAVETFLGGCIPAVTSIQVCWSPLRYITAYPRT